MRWAASPAASDELWSPWLDALVIMRAGDRTARAMLAAAAEIMDARPALVHSSGEAELALRSQARDLVVVDPDVASLTVVRSDAQADGPAIVGWLTARSSTRAAALLDAGASDVLDAAMGDAELAARLRRVARDHTVHIPPTPTKAGALAVDARLREASWQGRALSLTPREIQVLAVLVAAGETTVSREVIYRQVWRWAMPRGDRTVDVNVKRLRVKLAAAGVPVEIVTQPGIGYRLRVGETSEYSEQPVVTGL